MRFIIDRATWRNAKHGTGTVSLKNEEGYKCCLGFICEQSGITDICNRINPESLSQKDTKKVPFLVMGVKIGRHTDLSNEAMTINDSYFCSNEEREEKLKVLFAKYGIIIEFTGQYNQTIFFI